VALQTESDAIKPAFFAQIRHDRKVAKVTLSA
jgi:hypothetical protein